MKYLRFNSLLVVIGHLMSFGIQNSFASNSEFNDTVACQLALTPYKKKYDDSKKTWENIVKYRDQDRLNIESFLRTIKTPLKKITDQYLEDYKTIPNERNDLKILLTDQYRRNIDKFIDEQKKKYRKKYDKKSPEGGSVFFNSLLISSICLDKKAFGRPEACRWGSHGDFQFTIKVSSDETQIVGLQVDSFVSPRIFENYDKTTSYYASSEMLLPNLEIYSKSAITTFFETEVSQNSLYQEASANLGLRWRDYLKPEDELKIKKEVDRLWYTKLKQINELNLENLKRISEQSFEQFALEKMTAEDHELCKKESTTSAINLKQEGL